MTEQLRVVPLTLADANDMVARMHRHHKPVVGHRFSIGVVVKMDDYDLLVGAAITGRPVARMTDWTTVAEITRLVTDGTPNACSMLYGASARVCKAMGFTRIQTFILESEPGTSLKAAGWRHDGMVHAQAWSRDTRLRAEHAVIAKQRWVRDFG